MGSADTGGTWRIGRPLCGLGSKGSEGSKGSKGVVSPLDTPFGREGSEGSKGSKGAPRGEAPAAA